MPGPPFLLPAAQNCQGWSRLILPALPYLSDRFLELYPWGTLHLETQKERAIFTCPTLALIPLLRGHRSPASKLYGIRGGGWPGGGGGFYLKEPSEGALWALAFFPSPGQEGSRWETPVRVLGGVWEGSLVSLTDF